MKQGRKI